MDAAMTNFETKLRENAAKTEALLGRLLSGEARADEITRPQNLLDAMRHGVLNGGKRLRPFLVRFAKIGLAAAAITVATWFAFPATFIFFGILHAIAATSLVGLLFLRLPVVITLLAAAAAVAAPLYLRAPLFDHPALWWVGLSVNIPRSNDYVPLLPWLAPALLAFADIGVRLIPTANELKLGVVTAFLGVPVFLAYLLKERRLW